MAINRKSRSILEEISTYVPNRTRDEYIDSHSQHIIASAINMFSAIDDVYTVEEAEFLKKRFISSVRGGDPERFTRALTRVKNGDIGTGD